MPRPRSSARRTGARRSLRKVEETSAGGLVVDRTGSRPRAAIIGRLDRRGRLLWSLPKGHLEAGESAEDAAVREVEEETGIRGRVVAPLGTIDYWFVAEDRRIHKTVHHYLLEASGGELSDEDIEVDEVAWVPLDELRERLAYAGERRLAVRPAATAVSSPLLFSRVREMRSRTSISVRGRSPMTRSTPVACSRAPGEPNAGARDVSSMPARW